MIVYHGSNSNFKQLRISKSLVRYSSTNNNEGPGIYFSTDINVAKSYGKYLYTLKINDVYLKDFRIKQVAHAHVNGLRQHIIKNEHVDIDKYIDLNRLADCIYFGGIQIYNLASEIELQLENMEQWYRDVQSVSKRARVYQLARGYDKINAVVYMFNHNIKNIGVIKKIRDDIVRIVRKEIV